MFSYQLMDLMDQLKPFGAGKILWLNPSYDYFTTLTTYVGSFEDQSCPKIHIELLCRELCIPHWSPLSKRLAYQSHPFEFVSFQDVSHCSKCILCQNCAHAGWQVRRLRMGAPLVVKPSAGPLVFALNGQRVELLKVDPATTLLNYIRTEAGLRGTKRGCGEGHLLATPTLVLFLLDRCTKDSAKLLRMLFELPM